MINNYNHSSNDNHGVNKNHSDHIKHSINGNSSNHADYIVNGHHDCKHTEDDHLKYGTIIKSVLRAVRELPIPKAKKLAILEIMKVSFPRYCKLTSVVGQGINQHKTGHQSIYHDAANEPVEQEFAVTKTTKAILKLPILTKNKRAVLRTIRRELPSDWDSRVYLRQEIDQLDNRIFYIDLMVLSVTPHTYFVTITTSREYPDQFIKGAFDRVLKKVNEKFGRRKPHLYMTGKVMFERHNRWSNTTNPHFHCLLTPPVGHEDEMSEEMLLKILEEVIDPILKVVGVNKNGKDVAEATRAKTFDASNRPAFDSILFEEIYEPEELADYLTKNLQHEDVEGSDNEHGPGLYDAGRYKVTKVTP